MVLFKFVGTITAIDTFFFTFHYGSIQINCTEKAKKSIEVLHSTMVLFKFDAIQQNKIDSLLLHSTMVLFK